ILFPAYAGVFPISNRCAPFPFPAYAGVFQAEAAEKTVVAFPRVCGGVSAGDEKAGRPALPSVCGGVLVRRHAPLVKVDFLCYNTIIINTISKELFYAYIFTIWSNSYFDGLCPC